MFNKFQIEQSLKNLVVWVEITQPWTEKQLAVVQRQINYAWRQIRRLREFAYEKNSRITPMALKTATVYLALLEPVCEKARVWPEDS